MISKILKAIGRFLNYALNRGRFVVFLFLISQLNYAQKTEVVTVDSSLKKSVLFSNGLQWFAETFKSANDVIQMKDLESGTIIGKGILTSSPKSMGVTNTGSCHVTITLKIKEGRYKYEFSDIYYQFTNGTIWTYNDQPSMARKPWEKWKAEVDAEINQMVVDLKKKIIKTDDF